MKAIIGLGNPGTKYSNTRHNIGFAIINELSQVALLNSGKFKESSRLHSHIALAATSTSEPLLLVSPQTYMNDSGKAFIAIKNWYKLQLGDFLIVHDDVSLPLGKLRFQKEGGAGGQHGVESIINSLGGNKAINRLKIGVGPDPGGQKRAEFVLQKFTNDQTPLLNEVTKISVKACLSWLALGIDQVMNEYNGLSLDLENKSKLQSRDGL